MLWCDAYPADRPPDALQIKEFVNNPLWADLTRHLQQSHQVEPALFYSGCTMQQGYWKGWNLKYKKYGRSLCTLYPKHGYFVALIPVGEKERAEAELLLPFCSAYTQELYKNAANGAAGKSLPIEVKTEHQLRDVQGLVALRALKR